MSEREHLHELKMVATEQVRELQAMRAQMTELSSTMMAQGLNGVRETGIGVLDPTGVYSRDYRAPYAAVAVSNTSAGLVTLTNAPRDTQPPRNGIGVWLAPSGFGVVVNMIGTALCFYGTPGARFSYSVFIRPQPFAVGAVGTTP